MTIETKKYSRRPFDVEAVRVTKTNMEDVATWCKGEVVSVAATQTTKAENFIQIEVHTPATERQSRAFPGDYVLLLEGGKSFKVYTTKAFNKNFVLSSELNADSATPTPARAKKQAAKTRQDVKPANGIKPDQREALRKMAEVGQKAVSAVQEKGSQITESFKEAAIEKKDELADTVERVETKQDTPVDEPATPAAPVELAPIEPAFTDEEKAERAQANKEAELQVVERPIENTTQPVLEVTEPAVEAPKKRKFIQQAP